VVFCGGKPGSNYSDLEPDKEFWNPVRVPGSNYKSLIRSKRDKIMVDIFNTASGNTSSWRNNSVIAEMLRHMCSKKHHKWQWWVQTTAAYKQTHSTSQFAWQLLDAVLHSSNKLSQWLVSRCVVYSFNVGLHPQNPYCEFRGSMLAPLEHIAPNIANSLQSKRFWAIASASVSLRLWNLRPFCIVMRYVI